MSTAAQEHLDFLWPTLQSREEVQAADRLCRDMDDASLAHLLRPHSAGGVSTLQEIENRQTFDHALQSYCLLTVAIIAGYVPADLGRSVRETAKAFLNRGPVRLYYEKHYPVFLPCLLRLHVNGEISLPQESGDVAWGGFQWFVRFSGRFDKDRNLEAFLRLLDGFQYGDFNISSFIASLDKPDEALAGIVKPVDLLNRRDRTVLGMLRFMTFCREFAPALDAMNEAPLTQSACWFYYAYWFKGFREDVGDRVNTCLRIFDQWIQSSNSIGVAAALEAERTVAEVRTAMAGLIDGHYGAALLKSLSQLK
ncbi:MAG TPA: hypothetical protein VHA14_16435 [Bryobacteraceae bacterium]|nr:hypothetical protein [Bryobacteraceae bacterium]